MITWLEDIIPNDISPSFQQSVNRSLLWVVTTCLVVNNMPFHSRIVRDLAWALCHPPLFPPDGGSAHKQPLTEPLLEHWRDYVCRDYIDDGLLPWLTNLDQSPEHLLDYMTQVRSSGLGIYVEQLIGYYFAFYPRFQLLAKNYQINEGGHTLGEFDFIVFDRQQDKLLHIELALKFYLGHTQPPPLSAHNQAIANWHHWVGPNRHDSLSIKMHHLLQHQLILGNSPQGQSALVQLCKEIDPRQARRLNSRLLFLGRYYFPLVEPSTTAIDPPALTPSCAAQNHWLSLDHFSKPSTQALTESMYCLLPRSHWLSELSPVDIHQAKLKYLKHSHMAEYLATQAKGHHNSPTRTAKATGHWQLACVNPHGCGSRHHETIETGRLFIVQDDQSCRSD